MPIKDIEKRKAYYKEYRNNRLKNDPEFKKAYYKKIRETDKLRTNKMKLLITDFKSNGCKICGEKDECCLDAHHIDPNKKDIGIAIAISRGISMQRFKDELAKCVCVCANCHRKHHAGKINLGA